LNLGTIQRAGEEFTLIANSPARLADLETRFREVAPDAVGRDRHAERLSLDPGGRDARILLVDSYFTDASTVTDADEAAERLARDAETHWLDHPRVIGDLSPREAAASSDPAILAELRCVVDDIEAILLQTQRAGEPTTGLMSPHRLREALGLSDRTP
jgi:hypothetical protein